MLGRCDLATQVLYKIGEWLQNSSYLLPSRCCSPRSPISALIQLVNRENKNKNNELNLSQLGMLKALFQKCKVPKAEKCKMQHSQGQRQCLWGLWQIYTRLSLPSVVTLHFTYHTYFDNTFSSSSAILQWFCKKRNIFTVKTTE